MLSPSRSRYWATYRMNATSSAMPYRAITPVEREPCRCPARCAWCHLGAGPVTGMLTVKLGGKNMTFSQRVTARRLGGCPPEGK